jgi:Uma2 family endonuclease
MKRLSVDQYHVLITNGILTKEERVELLEGWIVQKKKKTPIVSTVRRLVAQQFELLRGVGDYHILSGAVTTDDSEPEPDSLIVRGNIRRFIDRHPSASDTAVLAEVSEASLKQDREKKRIYARAGFPVYWIVNIPDRQIEVYTQPSGPAENPDYARVQI